MSISPRYATHKLGPETAHKIELYLDYVCKFSAKAWARLRSEIIPAVESKYPGKVQWIFAHQVQPWHPQSTFVHEAGLAVSRLLATSTASKSLQNEIFFKFNDVLFERSTDFYDEKVYHETRPEIYERLADLAVEVLELYEKENKDKSIADVKFTRDQFLDLVKVKTAPADQSGAAAAEPKNAGNELNNDLKYFIKHARFRSVHVSPTIFIDGIPEPALESGTAVEVWLEKIGALKD